MLTFSIMTTALKSIVSKKKKRFQENGFDLDLSYILPNLIAMGYPAERVEKIYRNSIDDVRKFLENRHKDHYKIYNLCSERNYDHSKFHNRVALFPIDDHNPPPFERIKEFCEDVEKWLKQNEDNIAAIHCKAGKGRTGVMVCSYIIHAALRENAAEALNLYAEKRTKDMRGVTIPSQRRYVHYYERLVKSKKEYLATPILLKSIKMKSMPPRQKGFSLVIRQGKKCIFWNHLKCNKNESHIFIRFEPILRLEGDIKVELYNCNGNKGELRTRLFTLWFNTFFIKLESDLEHSQHLTNSAHGVRASTGTTTTITTVSSETDNTTSTTPSSPSHNNNLVNNHLTSINTGLEASNTHTIATNNVHNHSNLTSDTPTVTRDKSSSATNSEPISESRSPVIKNWYTLHDNFCDHIQNSPIIEANGMINDSSSGPRAPLRTSFTSNITADCNNTSRKSAVSLRPATSNSKCKNSLVKSSSKPTSAKLANYKTRLPTLVKINGRSAIEQPTSASALCPSSLLDSSKSFLPDSNNKQNNTSLFQEKRFSVSDAMEDGDYVFTLNKDELDKVHRHLNSCFEMALTFAAV